MEQNKQEKINKATFEGYLKENNLEQALTDRGQACIKGNIHIALSSTSSRKVQVFVCAMTKDGKINKAFEKWSTLLPDKTVSIAGILKENPSLDFEQAKEMATKLRVHCQMQEYVRMDDNGQEISMATFKTSLGGVTIIDSADKPFNPRFTFDADVYLNAISPFEQAGQQRAKVEGILLEYDGCATKLSFTSTPETVDFILGNFEKGMTTRITGDVISIAERKEKSANVGGFGRKPEPEYEVTFVNELQICGGTGIMVDENSGGFKTEAIKEGLVKRTDKIAQNTQASNTTSTKGFATQPTQSTKKFAFKEGGLW